MKSKATYVFAACLIALAIAVPCIFRSFASTASTPEITMEETNAGAAPAAVTTAIIMQATSTTSTTSITSITTATTTQRSSTTNATSSERTTNATASATQTAQTAQTTSAIEADKDPPATSAPSRAQEVADFLADRMPESYGGLASPDRPWRILTNTGSFYGSTQSIEDDRIYDYLEPVTDTGWDYAFISRLEPLNPEDFEFEPPIGINDYCQWCEKPPAMLYDSSMLRLSSKTNDETIEIVVVENRLLVRANGAEAYFDLPENRGYVVTERVEEDGSITGYAVDYALYAAANEMAHF